jgi:hypothetical protein
MYLSWVYPPIMPNPIQIILQTCPRPSGDDYFEATLRAILDTGGRGQFIQVCDDNPPSGYLAAFRKALATVLPGHDVLWFQDDLALCKNAVSAMIDCPVPPQSAFVTFYEGHHFNRKDPRVGLIPIRIRSGLWGNQALKFTAEAISFLKARWPVAIPPAYGDTDDQMVAMVLSAHYPEYSVCLPNLVQHVGDLSTLVLRGKPRDWTRHPRMHSSNYPGDDFDASTLNW